MQYRGRAIIALVLVSLSLFASVSYYIHIFGQHRPKIIKPLPNPLRFNNGTEVLTVAEWNVRREEIKAMLLEIEYGHMPGRPDAIQVELNTSLPIDGDQGSIGTELVLKIILMPRAETPSITISFKMWLYIPAGTGPFPTIINVGKDDQGTQDTMYRKIINHGYIFACFKHEDLDPDTNGYDEVGPCQSAYPEYDWGSLAVWAWGAMRVADVLLQEPWVQTIPEIPTINPDVLIITGHSRRGKTALLAGAYDDRFTMVVPNGSGCGGAGSFHIQGSGSETLASITSETRYKAWFHKDFGRFGGKEAELPFDQHFLRSLVAPRPILSTDGIDDLWANPPGTQAMYEAAQKVYDFLKVGKNNAIHFRSGGHGFLDEDFTVLLDFSDTLFFGKSVTSEFYTVPFDLHILYED